MDNVDHLDAHFKSLAYNICGVNTTNIQPINIYLINIIHIIHKPYSIKPRRPFCIVHNIVHKAILRGYSVRNEDENLLAYRRMVLFGE